MNIAQSRKMVGSIKKFDRQDHILNDDAGRSAFKAFLNKTFSKYRTIDNPNAYGIDLITLNEKDEVVFCWEIEVRRENWKGNIKFPFSDINCIERKEYMWRKEPELSQKIPYKMAANCKVYYVQLNDLCNRAVVIDGDMILQYDLKPWRNRKSDNEYVRQVPVQKTMQIRLG